MKKLPLDHALRSMYTVVGRRGVCVVSTVCDLVLVRLSSGLPQYLE